MLSELTMEKHVDASAEGGLKEVGEGRLEKTGFLEFVESDEVVLTKPVEIYLQYEEGYAHWVASFCPAAISASGETPREAIEELRRLLVFMYDKWITVKELPAPWWSFSPKLLGVLEEHFTRRNFDV